MTPRRSSVTSTPATDPAPRFATQRDPSRPTLGGKVAKISAALGAPFMPHQRLMADVTAEIDPATGYFFYREARILLPRQNGKTQLLLAKGTHRCLSAPRQRLVYTAQTRNMARRRLEEDFYDPISDSALAYFLARTGGIKPGFRSQAGSEHIAFANRSRWWIDAVTKKAGHGPPLDEGHIDEAFAHVDNRLEQAMSPAMSTKPNAQLWVASAAGSGDSTYLRAKVDDGRARIQTPSSRSRVAYFEWSAPDDADADDPAVWLACMPALGHTIDLSVIEAERDKMDDDEFRRAYLGQWRDAKSAPGVMPATAWATCAVPGGILAADARTGAPIWAIDVAPDRSVTTFALAAKSTDPAARVFVEVLGHIQGTTGIVDKLVELRAMSGGYIVALDGSGAAGSLTPDLEKAGFTVLRLSVRDKVDACGAIYDDVLDLTLRHLDDPNLNAAIVSASKRMVGDSAWLFTRKALADITPLYAVTIARWAYVKTAPGDVSIFFFNDDDEPEEDDE
jgi:hypothetical protein